MAQKIGILTFHGCINYGSYWQANCLAEGLMARGHLVQILNHYSKQVNIGELKCAYQPVLPSLVPESDYPLYRQKIERFFSSFTKLPLSAPFPLNEPEKMDAYDVVVVGSDEVWNMFHPWYGKNPLFFGDGIKADRLISYAASFGNYPASWGIDSFWADKLRNFDSIAVRDSNSQLIVKNALDFTPYMVLDPCMQFPVKPDYRNLDHLPEKYIAVYGHNFTNEYIREVKKWSVDKKLPLLSIGYRNDWADKQWLTADPHDFAHFISGAQAVSTNFFHGCVFSLINKKPFVCEATPYRTLKVNGLMEKLGGENHLVNSDTTTSVYNTCLSEPINIDISMKMDQLRRQSNQYLAEALGEDKQLQTA
ncbi:MAG: polysaccharide pyruvyl transferase family protein [Segetibacter sp.]